MRQIVVTIFAILAALPLLADPALWSREWPQTNFEKTTLVNWSEIISGGPPKDGIPALVDPAFVAAGDAALPQNEPVITVELAQQTPRAYPLRYLMWHEIVNDRIGVQIKETANQRASGYYDVIQAGIVRNRAETRSK